MEGLDINHIVVVHEYGKTPKWEPVKLGEPNDDEVTVRVEASTINPSDLMFLSGDYFQKPLPSPAGFEGTGKVVKAGKNAKNLEGKRVCFSGGGGAWSYFANVNSRGVFVIDEDVPVSSAASGIVNPLTALGFISQVKRLNQKGFIFTAAASALGRMTNRLAAKEKFDVINLVRKQQHADLLKKEGIEHVIVTTGDWQKTLSELIQKLNINILLDCLGGGAVQRKIIDALPKNGTVFVYGALEKDPTTVSSKDLISGLTIRGFYLTSWLGTITPAEHKQISSNYSAYLKNELSSSTSKEFKLEDFEKALKYYKDNMTQGKVLLKA